MTIKEYYDNYNKNKNYTPELWVGEDRTISDFYNNCLSKHIGSPAYIANAKAWHKMLLEYAEEPDAIFWVRYHENAPKNPSTGRFQTRRACKTVFEDGTTYVFVSNYDAHEIFNMVRLGVVPDKNEFKSLMQNHQFPMHYDAGGSCEESDVAAYLNNIGSVKGGVLTYGHWYLAHIVGIKSDVYVKNSQQLNIDISRLYPRGEITDWQDDNGVKVRKLNYSPTAEEKEIIKAHFLRFIDPLNYYVVPGEKYQNNGVCKQIGSSYRLNDFMRKEYFKIYQSLYKDFEQKALAPQPDEIFMSYAPPAKKAGKNSKQQSKKPAAPAGKVGGTKSIYEFDGLEYISGSKDRSLRKLPLAMVNAYLHKNPNATYADLMKAFDMKLDFGKKHIIRLLSDLTSNDISTPRVFINEQKALADGNVIVVNNQLTGKDMQGILAIAKKLGYNIIKK